MRLFEAIGADGDGVTEPGTYLDLRDDTLLAMYEPAEVRPRRVRPEPARTRGLTARQVSQRVGATPFPARDTRRSVGADPFAGAERRSRPS